MIDVYLSYIGDIGEISAGSNATVFNQLYSTKNFSSIFSVSSKIYSCGSENNIITNSGLSEVYYFDNNKNLALSFFSLTRQSIWINILDGQVGNAFYCYPSAGITGVTFDNNENCIVTYGINGFSNLAPIYLHVGPIGQETNLAIGNIPISNVPYPAIFTFKDKIIMSFAPDSNGNMGHVIICDYNSNILKDYGQIKTNLESCVIYKNFFLFFTTVGLNSSWYYINLDDLSINNFGSISYSNSIKLVLVDNFLVILNFFGNSISFNSVYDLSFFPVIKKMNASSVNFPSNFLKGMRSLGNGLFLMFQYDGVKYITSLYSISSVPETRTLINNYNANSILIKSNLTNFSRPISINRIYKS